MSSFVLGLALGCNVSLSSAAEDQPHPQAVGQVINSEQEEPAVSFETEGDFFLGYRWVSTEDSLKAAEYIYPHSSATFGLNLLSAPLPYRYHLNGEYLSKYDFYADGGFAYKDLVLFRDILVGVHHNLYHYNYQFAGEPPDLIYTDRNPTDAYSVDFVSNLMSLRLKTPEFPFHAFLNHRHVNRDGKIQQRFLLGYFDELEKVSESRDINWDSEAIKLGANSHLGPVEIEYAYDYAEFDPGSNNVLKDPYPLYDPDPPGIGRPADTYPHNVIPETESSAHTIKMHSSYTGGIVAAATFSNLFQKNNYSLTESTTWKGALDFSWIPDPVFGLFFKYRHRDVDMDTPNTVTLHGDNSAITYPVRQGISYDKDVFSLSSRYKPLQRLSLFAKYEFSYLERKKVDEWLVLTPQTKIHSIDLRVHARLLDRIMVKAIYEYKNYDQPAYNITPDNSNKLKLTTDYAPSPSLNLYLEYILFLSERSPLRYPINTDPISLLETGERDGRGDQILASLSTAISPKASLTFSWFYQRWEIEQDLVYGKWPGTGDPPYFMDTDVPYTDKANSFSFSLHWIPRDDITVSADLTHTITEGTTRYNDVTGDAAFSLSSFSDLETSETNFSIDLAKKLPKDWETGLRFYYDIFNDKPSGYMDGNVFITTFSLKRSF